MMNKKNVVVIGKFDGVHIGHRALIECAVGIARSCGMRTVAYAVLPVHMGKSITTESRKEEIIRSLGVDEYIRQPLSDDFARLSPEEFVDNIIKDKLCAGHVAVGYNFRFGANRAGDALLLQKLCDKNGVSTTVMESVNAPDENGNMIPVSSTRIRALVEKGDTVQIRRCLGRNFCMWGTVGEGKKLGRTLGFPTVNLYPDSDSLIPAHGVYASKVYLDSRDYIGVTNVGINPTVETGTNIKVETFIFGFSGNLYGKKLHIELLEHVRPERKFDGVDELKTQIDSDKDYVYNKYVR